MFEMHGSAHPVARPTCRASSSILAGAIAMTISTAASRRLEVAGVELADKRTVPFHHDLTDHRTSAVVYGAENLLTRPHAASGA